MSEERVPENMSSFFGVYSSIEKRPVIRAWARSKDEADGKLNELRTADAKTDRGEEEEYYVVRLSKPELEGYRQGGFIPSDA
ncbi:MAG: hypothetical protein V3T05_06805 [Myxococcota bacterium]